MPRIYTKDQKNNIQQTKFYEGTFFGTREEIIERANDIGCEFLLTGDETCPTTGRKHLQFVIIFKNKIRPATAGHKMGCGLFPLRREITEAIDYIIDNPDKPNPVWCIDIGRMPKTYKSKKEKKIKEDPAVVANRNRELIALARQGKFDIIEERYPGRYLLSYNVLNKIFYDNIARPKKDLVKGLWLRGPSGLGKSTWLRNYFEDDTCYPYNKISHFFERYRLETTLTIDELGMGQRWVVESLKVWCNENLTLLNVKGSSCWSYFNKVIVTSQYTPNQIAGKDDLELLEAIDRRFMSFRVVSRVDNDLMVFWDNEERSSPFPFSLNNYLRLINFLN